jgi:hypothetical protein
MKATAKVAVVAVGALVASVASVAQDRSEAKTTETSVVTNANGLVTRTFTERNVVTNGTMRTGRVRVTTTTMDPDGNVVGTSTSEVSHSIADLAEPWLDDDGIQIEEFFGDADALLPGAVSHGFVVKSGRRASCAEDPKPPARDAFSFLGVKLGEVAHETGDPSCAGEAAFNAGEPSCCLRQAFTPQKGLAGFSEYRMLLAPKSRRVVGVIARAEAGRGDRWREYEYLGDALRLRYGKIPKYTGLSPFEFRYDLDDGRFVVLNLRAPRGGVTVSAYDGPLCEQAKAEMRELESERMRKKAEEHTRRIQEAAGAF